MIGLLGLGFAFAVIGRSPPLQASANNLRAVAKEKPEAPAVVAAIPAGVQESDDQQEPGHIIRGTLAAIDPNERTITVRRGEQRNQTFSANEAKVLIDGREAAFDNLKTSWRVSLETNQDESSARIIQVEGPTVTGIIHDANVADGLITLLHGDNARSVSSFPVMENRRAELSRVTVGSRITLQLTTDRKQVVQIIGPSR